MLKLYCRCTIDVMTQRPAVEEDTVERLDKNVKSAMAISPDSVGVDKKINVLIDEYNKMKSERNSLQRQMDSQGRQGNW